MRNHRLSSEAYLELVLQQVLLVWELAIEAEELGFFRRHFLCVVSDLELPQPTALPKGQQCEQQESCAGAANDVR